MAGNQSRAIPNNFAYKVSQQVPVYVVTDDGALNVNGGIVILNKAGAIAATLAAPNVDGVRLVIYSLTAQAHTVTVANGLRGAGAGVDVGTFGGAIMDGVTLFSYGGYWHVEPGTNVNVTFA